MDTCKLGSPCPMLTVGLVVVLVVVCSLPGTVGAPRVLFFLILLCSLQAPRTLCVGWEGSRAFSFLL